VSATETSAFHNVFENH